ncbi:MAG: DUF167 domain-containing protein [Chitinispirillaceae bacterium]|jgi:hypothetical protein|nr:DUF167 domain-containing protein [Chitinispirillaceae bacterium]
MGRLEIRLQPRAKNDRITADKSGAVRIAVTSPPIDDRANGHLIRVLAKALAMPRSSLSIIKGGHGRNKIVEASGLTTEQAVLLLKKGVS